MKRRDFLQGSSKFIVGALALGSMATVSFAQLNKGANMNQLSKKAQENLQRFFKSKNLPKEDLEFFTTYANFAFDEVWQHSQGLDEKERFLLILASLIAINSKDEFETMLKASLNANVDAVAIKEVIYQATPYAGMAKVADCLNIANKVFKQRGIKLPLANQGTTSANDRYEKGLQAQVDIFGEGMRKARDKALKDQRHIREFLSANCFGDYYTRTGLELKFRELITFVYLAAMGGAQPQLEGHVQGNLNMGNDRAKLISVLTALIPYIGYPRTLNALSAIDKLSKA